MASNTKNLALIFLKPPTRLPVVGEHINVQDNGPFDLDQTVENGLVLETLYASLDPYLRGTLRDPSIKSYSASLPYGSPVVAGCLARVLRSNLEGYAEGDVIRTGLPIQQYNVYVHKPGTDLPYKIPNPDDPAIDLRHYLGALGMPGLTAWSSLYEIGKPKKDEIIVVSSAAGAVGQLVGKIAKHEGLVVLGSVGSDDKLDFIMNDLEFDGGWNYKKEKSTKDVIERLIQEQKAKGRIVTEDTGIDIFYDNVGGEQLDSALQMMNLQGR
jgi:NADPH-dependent curcumin reductase CurA